MRLRIVAAEGAVRENLLDNEEPGRGARWLPWRGTSARGICTLADSFIWLRNKSSGSNETFILFTTFSRSLKVIIPWFWGPICNIFNLPRSNVFTLRNSAAIFQLCLFLTLCCIRFGPLTFMKTLNNYIFLSIVKSVVFV